MTADQYAPAVLKAGQDLGITPRGIVIGFATVYVESDWLNYANAKVPESLDIPHDAVGSDGYSVGLFQQQVVMGGAGWWWGDAATCMDPYKSAQLFFARLARLDYNNTANWPGSYAQAVQGSAFPDRYDQRIGDAQTLYDQLTGGQVTAPDPRLAALQAARPDFNEYDVLASQNFQDRGDTEVDLILGHTEESSGYDDADGLAHWLETTTDTGNPVSYHRTLSKGQNDDGVTVCNVVPIAKASWSVGNSNDRSINMCFAGSSVNWSRQEWMDNCGRCFDVFGYLAVRDAVTLGWTSCPVIPGPGYDADPPGVSDHRYCTDYLRDGNTHVDMGDNVPWDLIETAVAKYWAVANATPTPGPAPDPAPTSAPVTDRELLQEVWDQLRGPGGNGWPQLGGRTLVDAVAELLKAAPHGN